MNNVYIKYLIYSTNSSDRRLKIVSSDSEKLQIPYYDVSKLDPNNNTTDIKDILKHIYNKYFHVDSSWTVQRILGAEIIPNNTDLDINIYYASSVSEQVPIKIGYLFDVTDFIAEYPELRYIVGSK
jgi:hypothetical protein